MKSNAELTLTVEDLIATLEVVEYSFRKEHGNKDAVLEICKTLHAIISVLRELKRQRKES